MIVVVFGLPGSGKSTVAGRLARRLGAVWISSDAIRAERGLLGEYSKESIAAVYLEMMARARCHLAEGSTVVLDGSFSNRRFRDQVRRLAETAGVRLAFIHMLANEKTSLRRVARRRKLTEAGPEAYRLLQRHFDPVEDEHLALDSSTARVNGLLQQALLYLSGE